MQLDIDDTNIETRLSTKGSSSPLTFGGSSPVSKIAKDTGVAIKRIIMTRTEEVTYPNGNVYFRSSTWESGRENIQKKVKPKDRKKAPETKIREEEAY